MRPRGILIRSALIAALGGLLFRFDTAVISGAEKALEQLFSGQHQSMAQHSGRPTTPTTGPESGRPVLQRTTFWHGTVFISEIFPNALRARGQALGSLTHWIMAALISQTFPMFAEQLGWRIFAIYGVCMAGQLFWVLLVMPETKGISLEEMQQERGIE